jgi:alkylation response protein AidB-like acyl-CoA dehydrogenase
MIDFSLTEEHELIRSTAARFAEEQLRPREHEREQNGPCSVLLWHPDDRDPPDTEPRPHHVIRRFPELLALL